MRLRDKNKEQHEKSVADDLLKKLGKTPVSDRSGNPDNNEPDRLYLIDKKTIGIEVVTAYYSEGEAKATAEAAAEKPIAPGEIRPGKVIGSPDDSICESIQENLDAKCSKKYSGTDERWLCINVDAPLTELECLKECVDNLDVPENQFDRIYVTVSKPEGGIAVFEIPARKPSTSSGELMLHKVALFAGGLFVGILIGVGGAYFFLHHHPAVLRPNMTMSEVELSFGKPDRIDVVDGRIDDKYESPKEILWVYSRYKITDSGESYGKPGHIRFIPMRFTHQKWGPDDDTARQYGEQADTFRTCSFSGSFPIRKKDWAADDFGLFDGVPLKELQKVK